VNGYRTLVAGTSSLLGHALCGGLAALLLLLPAPGRAQSATRYTISTLAGTGSRGSSGDDGAALDAELAGPYGLALDSSGNIFFSDQGNERVRKIDTAGTITTLAGDGSAGYVGDNDTSYAADEGEMRTPSGVLVDSKGQVWFADTGNHQIRMVTADGYLTYKVGIPGASGSFTGDGGVAPSAQLNGPTAIHWDSHGNLFIADTDNNRIRRVDAATNIITTVAGVGPKGYSGDGAKATLAQLNKPHGIVTDSAGNLYIADSGNHRIRKVDTNGIITTVVGTGEDGFYGDFGLASAAKLSWPGALTMDAAGNLYISDRANYRIRKVLTSGVIVTIAGNGVVDSDQMGVDGDPAASISVGSPTGMVLDSKGNLYIADPEYSLIRKLTPTSDVDTPPTVTSVIGATDCGAFSAMAPGSWIEIYGSKLSSASQRSWALSDFDGNTAPTTLEDTRVTIGGLPAALSYLDGTQINAQVPSGVATGQQPLVVTTMGGASDTYTVTVNAVQPGLLAPASFKVGGKQYVAALFPDYSTFVAPAGSITGVTSKSAKPGDSIVMYGTGFGPVTPTQASGQIVEDTNTLTLPLSISFGGVAAKVDYAGLAPLSVGLYQFNVEVPNVAPSDGVPVTFSVGGVNNTQTLYIAISN
jgi:uncharacterized protein (TIGR03437 family)